MLKDKVDLKKINLQEFFTGFDSFLVKTDKRRLQQVLLNLLSNAVKFTDRNGAIKVMVELIRDQSSQQLRLSISDDGAGVKEENQSKLFKMFGTYKD
jgi:two-component system sensor histidine kinase/response regulator